MTLKSVPLAALLPPKDNPRRTVDETRIEGLAESIKTDGVLQNLVVEPDGEKFRVVTGKRRFLALRLLRRKGVIDGAFKVPIEVRRNMTEDDAMRIATVENVQREPLDPMDEADAFAALLQHGAAIEDVAAKTGLSDNTIRRRLAIANLCGEAKEAIRKGELSLGVAEAMTLGTEDQQRSILQSLKDGIALDRDAVREMLLAEKPSVAIAIFPRERYTGSCTSDLFGTEDTTYFDDVEQFFTLQKEAVEQLAEKHRKKAAFVDVFNVYSAPWWQYREAKKKERAGVVINLTPTGRVEVRKGLVRHEVQPTVAESTKETPEAPKERSLSVSLIRYAARQKSAAVQAALLRNPRKAKEVAAVQLLRAFGAGGAVRITLHPCIPALSLAERKPLGFVTVQGEAKRLMGTLDLANNGSREVPAPEVGSWKTPVELYQAVGRLSDEDLDGLVVILLLLSFGQEDMDALDTDGSLFNRVALDLGVSMRDWWSPDVEFLSHLRKDQLEAVAAESGASLRMGKFKDYAKKELVEALVRYFERTAAPDAQLDEHDAKGRLWLPGPMAFPARALTVEKN